MKKKNVKITEDTSNTTGGLTNSSTNSSTTYGSSANKNTTVYVKQPELKKTVTDLKGTDANVMVTNEVTMSKPKFEYLSEVKGKDGKISQPFTINGKQYQMVRARSSAGEPVSAVYSLDERDEEGKNVIYDIKEFETNVAQKYLQEQPEEAEPTTDTPVEPSDETTVPKETGQGKEHDISFFQGHKHFIVNEKTGRVRKLKTIADLAEAKMEKGEKYMGLKEFRKYLDERLFGKRIKEEQPAPAAAAPAPEIPAVTHMFKLINSVLPGDVWNNIKQNPAAQAQAITEWMTLVGVPPTKVNDIVTFARSEAAKAQAKPTNAVPQATATSSTTTTPAAPVNEEVKIVKTIKVKDIK